MSENGEWQPANYREELTAFTFVLKVRIGPMNEMSKP
jgi:hypothetical protein